MPHCTRQMRTYMAITLVCGALLGCGKSSSNSHDWVASTAMVTRSTITDVIGLAGQVSALDSRELRFRTVGGRVLDVLVGPGQVVNVGDALVQLDTSNLERALREAQADLVVAQAELVAAQQSVSPAQLALANADVTRAEYELAAAKLELDLATEAGLAPLEQAVADKQDALQQAQDGLAHAQVTAGQTQIRQLEYDQAFYQRALRDLKPGEDPAELQQRLALAETDLAVARAAREDTLSGERDRVTQAEEELAAVQSALKRAQHGELDPLATYLLTYHQTLAGVKAAQDRLEELTKGTDSDALAHARIAFEAAEARVESARDDIEAATLRAPIDAVVFDVYVQPDTWVTPSDLVAYLADPSELHVLAQASDVDVAHIVTDQQVRVSFPGNPSQLIEGRVCSVAERGQTTEGMVTYEVDISLEDVEVNVIPGMMSMVRVLVGERENVLSVPAAAIQYTHSGEAFVSICAADDSWRDQPVRTGMNDGIMVEILSGLEEGQTVSVPVFAAWTPDQEGMPPDARPVP